MIKSSATWVNSHVWTCYLMFSKLVRIFCFHEKEDGRLMINKVWNMGRGCEFHENLFATVLMLLLKCMDDKCVHLYIITFLRVYANFGG